MNRKAEKAGLVRKMKIKLTRSEEQKYGGTLISLFLLGSVSKELLDSPLGFHEII